MSDLFHSLQATLREKKIAGFLEYSTLPRESFHSWRNRRNLCRGLASSMSSLGLEWQRAKADLFHVVAAKSYRADPLAPHVGLQVKLLF